MFKIFVPASTANLGPGFDALGLALGLYNTFTFELLPEGKLEINSSDPKYNNRENLVFRTLEKMLAQLEHPLPGLSIGIQNEIPISRGLGSSAACILAGVMAANEIAGSPMNQEEIFQQAATLEGHSDNMASQLFGGLTASAKEGDRFLYRKIPMAKAPHCLALIPDFHLKTVDSRRVLPKSLTHGEAVKNVGHTALLLAALMTGEWRDLALFVEDSLHEPYRKNLIPDYDRVLQAAYAHGALVAYLSGGGPTLMTFFESKDKAPREELEQALQGLQFPWRVLSLPVCEEGARLTK